MATKSKNKQIFLTPEQALDVLDIHLNGKKKRVHTMQNFAFGMMGCDMDLSDIKKAFKNGKSDDICISGPNMRGAKHGVAIWYNDKYWLFISTDEEKLNKLEKSLRK